MDHTSAAEMLDSGRCGEAKTAAQRQDGAQPRPLVDKDEKIGDCMSGAKASDQGAGDRVEYSY